MHAFDAWRAESMGQFEGVMYRTCVFSGPPQHQPPRVWASGNGPKGAILNGISGQGAEVHRLRD